MCRAIMSALVALAIVACASKATDRELDRMCVHLLELRGKVGDKAMMMSCVENAKKENVTQKQALCRISAVNIQEYWHRCRTGEARSR